MRKIINEILTDSGAEKTVKILNFKEFKQVIEEMGVPKGYKNF